ncbi:MAG: NADP-dependent oxidoreductase [Alphaproteobacteria bacterium]|nr:NADP-dependent oxidoreductase [Alphaproteobacteria bacterium]
MKNRQVLLRHTVTGRPTPEDFTVSESVAPEAREGEVLVKTLYLSLDPYMGSAIKGRHMSGAVAPGGVMPGETIGRVVQSRHAKFREGDLVQTRAGWQEYAIAVAPDPHASGMAAAISRAAHPLAAAAHVPLSAYLGVLGMPGLTAYAGTLTCLEPKPGENIVTSAAAGAVGSALGQIARNMGARAIGLAGSEAKCAHVVQRFGFAACINYKKPGWQDALAAACPGGVHGYSDNSGGAVLEGVVNVLAPGGRIMLIGLMDQYNTSERLPGPALGPFIGKRARVTGFVVYDHYARLGEWRRLGATWMGEGRLAFHEERIDGLAKAPDAFSRLMAGETMGKLIVAVARE